MPQIPQRKILFCNIVRTNVSISLPQFYWQSSSNRCEKFIAKSNKLPSIVFQIASHSKASTKSRFWNRSFHILSCDRSMESSDFTSTPSCNARTSMVLDKLNNSENSRSRLDRKQKSPFEELSWSRCNRQQSFLVAVIIVLLNLTTIECLQARQEGECVWNPKLLNYLICVFMKFCFDNDEVKLF